MTEEKLKKYGSSEFGNFEVIDTIGVPHPYCISGKHLRLNVGMVLDIPATEKLGAVCDICKKRNKKFGDPILSFGEHRQALLVECRKDPKENDDEIRGFLKSIADMSEKEGYAGFAFIKKF